MKTWMQLLEETKKTNTNFNCACCGKNLRNKSIDYLIELNNQVFNIAGKDYNKILPSESKMVRVGEKCATKKPYLNF